MTGRRPDDISWDASAEPWNRSFFVVIPVLALFAILAFAIIRSGDDTPSVEGVEWVLDELRVGDSLTPVVSGSAVTLRFSEGTVSGNSGCNQYSGSYAIEGSSIAIGDLLSTLAFCDDPPGTADQEAAYLALLTDVESIASDKGVLVLADGSGDSLAFRGP